MNASTIGEQINMSVSAVIERIKKLESSGIIQQYTAVIDAKKIGMDITAFISVGVEHPKYHDSFIRAVEENTRVVECHYITGDFDFILKVAADSTESLERLLHWVKSIRGVSMTKTLVVLSTVKHDLGVLPDAPA